MTPKDKLQPIALKEWAVSVKALQEGKQIVVMRKGGIIEETRDFRLLSNSFFLMPAFEHQRKELLKVPFQDDMDETLKGWTPDMAFMTLSSYAEVTDDIEITDQETLDRLREHHIWTDAFAEERLKWKRKNPLHLLILKVHRLDIPVNIPMRPAYTGCKSWVRLEDGISESSMAPVLEESVFAEKRDRIRRACIDL